MSNKCKAIPLRFDTTYKHPTIYKKSQFFNLVIICDYLTNIE